MIASSLPTIDAYAEELGKGPRLSVCQVLSQTSLHRGKIVRVEGVMLGGYHGSALFDRTVAECPILKKRGTRWPAGISLVWPTQRTLDDGPRTFQPDNESIDRNLAGTRQQMRDREDLLLSATFVGELRARRGIRISWTPDDGGWFGGDGYGHLGQYPAQLVIQTVIDATTIERQNWKPGLAQIPTSK